MSKRPFNKKEIKRKATDAVDHILTTAEVKNMHPLRRKALISFLTDEFVSIIKYKSPKKSES